MKPRLMSAIRELVSYYQDNVKTGKNYDPETLDTMIEELEEAYWEELI